MSDCTSTGVPGNAISLSEAPIPANVLVTLSGYAQSSAGQTATVTDTNGNVVATISSAGTSGGSLASMTTSGGAGIATFTSSSSGVPYSIAITNSGSQTSQVLPAFCNLAGGTTTFGSTWVFMVEDTPSGGDCDFNDCTVYLTWNLFSG